MTARSRTGQRDTYHHGDLRAALVEAAARMAADAGPAAVSLREVARRAGVSQAAPYHHFADKAALLAAVAEEGFRLFDAHQAAALEAAGDDPIERLAALGVSYLRFAVDQPHYFLVMFRPALVTGPCPPDLERWSASAFERLLETTRSARLASGRRDRDPYPAALAMWAVPHGFSHLCLEQSTGTPLDAGLLEALVRDSCRALAAVPLDHVRRLAR